MTVLETLFSAIADARERGRYPAEIVLPIPADRSEAFHVILGRLNKAIAGIPAGSLIFMSIRASKNGEQAVFVLFDLPRGDRPDDQYVDFAAVLA